MRLDQTSWPQSPTGSELSEEELMEHLRSGLKALSLYSEDNVLTRELQPTSQHLFPSDKASVRVPTHQGSRSLFCNLA